MPTLQPELLPVLVRALSGPGLMAPANAFDRSSIEQGKRKGEEEGEECEVEDEAGAVEGGADYA